MNRVATRALIIMALILAMLFGMAFFAVELLAKGESWVMFSGSPHAGGDSKASSVTVLDGDGQLLSVLSGKRVYAQDSMVRKATMHWIGDRKGNIQAIPMGYYTEKLVEYDPWNGVYQYGGADRTIQLSLVSEIQAAALEAMGEYVGTVAVYNYRTGQLLCAVTTPTYDPDNVPDIAGDTTGAFEGVYINRFLQSKYIPGSIFKIVTLAAALETIEDIESQTFVCTGACPVGNGEVTCEKVHGTQSLSQAFTNSCNCAFTQIVGQIGKEKLVRYVEQFGVTDSVFFDGITTAGGNFDVQDAGAESLAWSGIGQYKDLVNPCGYMTFVGSIANGGAVSTPYVVSQVKVGPEVTYQASGSSGERIMSQSTAEIIRTYMQNNVTNKYGVEHFLGLTVCAKTGTAQVGGDKKPNAMFTGFVADEEYPLAFIVVIEDGGYGAPTCIPVISKVLQVCKDYLDG